MVSPPLKSSLLVLVAAAVIALAPTPAAWAQSMWDQQCRNEYTSSDAGRTSGGNICWWQSGYFSGGQCTITAKCFVGETPNISTVTVGWTQVHQLQNCTGYIALSC